MEVTFAFRRNTPVLQSAKPAFVDHSLAESISILRSYLSWTVSARYVPGVVADIPTGDVDSPPSHPPPRLQIGVRVRVSLSQQAAVL